jgi:raffinose synthase
LAKEYEVIAKPGLKPCNMKKQEIGLVSKTDIYRFYQDFHANLRQAGVDMVKIDSQSGMQELCAKTVGYGETMAAYQKAMQASTQTHFEGNLLHCMCNTQDVAYHMSASSGWRNSDDFYPDQKPSHARHMVINAYNAVWTHTFACPDWDMFMSGHYTGSFHAAARAISGGPVYISDKPGDHDATIIKRLCLSDGRALRSEHPALPLSRRIYDNPEDASHLLFVRNHNGTAGVMGAFHCAFEGGPISDSFTVQDLGFGRGEFALWYARAGKLERIHSRDKISITLNELEAEIIHVAPLDEGVAILGLIDKDNATAAVISHGWDRDSSYRIQLKDGGTLGVYCLRQPRNAVSADGTALKMKHDSVSGLLQVSVKTGGAETCCLYW